MNKILREAIYHQPDLLGMDAVLEKEILHLDLLKVLMDEGFLNKLTFIGGTCLRLCYNAVRLSEDLDFTGGQNFKPQDFAGLADHLKDFLQRKYALDVQASEPTKAAGDTSTWKVTLTTNPGRPDLPSQKMHIDVCAYDSLDATTRPIISHHLPSAPMAGVMISAQSLRELMADKMIAFAFRQRRIKPRDVWDIVWLHQQGVTQDETMIQEKLSMRGKSLEVFSHHIQDNLRSLLEDDVTRIDFDQEMSRFLPISVRAKTVAHPEFYRYLGQVVGDQCVEVLSKLTQEVRTRPKWDMS